MAWLASIRQTWAALRDAAKVQPLRTLRQFAEQEIILPTGPFEGRPFRAARHPVAGLLLDEAPRWRRVAITGPGQDGKSLCGLVIPTLYHLFEVNEDVIIGLPNEEMAADKWRDDILPAIEASKFRELMPRRGGGSRGGKVLAIKFRNGRVLRFMSAGGRDKSRAGKTARVVVISEVDGMDKPAGGSKEADPVRQIEARTNAFKDQSRSYLECTPSTEEGRIWKEYMAGTSSAIEVPCPHCSKWIRWEREHLVGWQDAATVIEAGEKARLVCPECGSMIDEAERVTAIGKCRLSHGRQVTDTLGFRWNAAVSPLKSIGEIAKDEWKASQADDENAHKAMDQFVWCKPSKPEKVSLSETDWSKIAARQGGESETRGRVPSDVTFLTAAADLQAESLYWTLTGWSADGSGRIVDYGVLDVPSRDLGRARAIEVAVKQFAERLVYQDLEGRRVARAIVDAGNWQAEVVAACRSMWPRVLPAKGFGESQVRADRDISQTGYEAKRLDTGDALIELLADAWKTKVHDALQIPVGKPGALVLYHVKSLRDHLAFVKHLTAERKVTEYIPGKGNKTKWELVAQHRPNHWLDATAMSYAAMRIQLDNPGSSGGQAGTPAHANPADGKSTAVNPLTSYKGKW